MCDCCAIEGRDYEFRCGASKSSLRPAHLYNVYIGRVASVKLCRLCDIELFNQGESRFLADHIKFAQNLVNTKTTAASIFD